MVFTCFRVSQRRHVGSEPVAAVYPVAAAPFCRDPLGPTWKSVPPACFFLLGNLQAISCCSSFVVRGVWPDRASVREKEQYGVCASPPPPVPLGEEWLH